jgi:hypothetical protein
MKKTLRSFLWLIPLLALTCILLTPLSSFAATAQTTTPHIAQTTIKPVPCGNVASFVKIHYNFTLSTECFAYDGYLGLGSTSLGDLNQVDEFHAGNNCGWYEWQDTTSNRNYVTFNSNDDYGMPILGVTIGQLDIEGQNCHGTYP